MNVPPTSFGLQRSAGPELQVGNTSRPRSLHARWSALEDVAGLVASLAGIKVESADVVDPLSTLLESTGGWRCNLAEETIADISVVMESGLMALLAANRHGVDTGPAARALWEEFAAARAGLQALARGV